MLSWFRGYEFFKYQKTPEKRIKKAILNVINEQDRQKVFGYNDIQKIALINKKANDLARAKALELGLMDYDYVQKKVRCECNLVQTIEGRPIIPLQYRSKQRRNKFIFT